MQIHPSAAISPQAKIGNDVKIGPFCVIEKDVEIGNGCRLESRVSVKTGTILGENNTLAEGAVLGGIPQHIAIHDVCGQLVVGNGNVFRENSTVHRAMKASEATVIGDNNMIMVNAHVAHDCRFGDNIVLVNNVMVAGHVSIGDRAIISGAAGIHQFCRIGSYAMVGGQAHVVQDVPPFMMLDGLTSRIVGLNLIGLRRAGFSSDDIKRLKSAYRTVFRSQLPWREMLKTLEESCAKGPVLELFQFLTSTTRGIIKEGRTPGVRTLLRIHEEYDEDIDENELRDEFSAPLKINVG